MSVRVINIGWDNFLVLDLGKLNKFLQTNETSNHASYIHDKFPGLYLQYRNLMRRLTKQVIMPDAYKTNRYIRDKQLHM